MNMLRRSKIYSSILCLINGSLGLKGKNVYQQVLRPQKLCSFTDTIYQRVS
jgi:hypothetical protein